LVAQIEAAGGKAVASLQSVAEQQGAEQIIATALDSFGRIDCVVNNAGILRDTIFHRMSSDDFEQVVRVHLFGSFYVSRAAASHFRKQGSGSYVHFTSASGLIGNLGQAGYSAAKLGVVGYPSRLRSIWALRRPIQLHHAVCLEPFDRLAARRDTPEERKRVETFQEHGSGKDCTAHGISGQRSGSRGDGPDFRGAQK